MTSPQNRRLSKPDALPVLADNIPDELKRRSQFVGWRWEQREGGKWTKPPVDVKTGRYAKPNVPTTWASFSDALQAYELGRFSLDGIGYVFTDEDSLSGTDLDDCIDGGDLQPWAAEIVGRLGSYAEVSPSGTGVKIIHRGDLPGAGTNKPHSWPAEMYSESRYFALTGQLLPGSPATIANGADTQAAITWLYERIKAGPPPWAADASLSSSMGINERDAQEDPSAHRTAPARANGTKAIKDTTTNRNGHSAATAGVVALADADLLTTIRRSSQAAKFDRLFRGDTSGYTSPSQADIALCNMLAFYTSEATQIDRLFQQSELHREKWDNVHNANGDTYGEMTIADALGYVRSRASYDPDFRSGRDSKNAHSDPQTTREKSTEGGRTTPPDNAPPLPPGLSAHVPWLPLGDILKGYERAEMGDAELLAKLYAGRIAYDHAEKTWHVWAGHHWQRDKRRQVRNLPGSSVAAQYLQAAAELTKKNGSDVDRDKINDLHKRARSLRNRTRIAHVLELATSQPALALSGNEWDARPWLLAVKNGVLDLKTGELQDGRPGDFLRTNAPTGWEGLDAPAPRWERFLSEVFDNDAQLIDFVQRLLGYSIAGLSTEHVMPILWGKGRNGKDTLLKALAHTLGAGFADTVPEDVFIDAGRANGGAAAPHVYKLRGLRLAWANETEEGARLKPGQVKQITGGGKMTARPLYGAPVSWNPTHTLLLITNHKPHVPADDYALWKRLALIPFTLSFVDEPKEAHERKRDANLDAKLWAEAPAILAWLVRGCLAWQREGLRPPDTVKAATEAYQTEEDTLGQYLDENCVIGPQYRCKASQLYQNYKTWCTDMGIKPMTGTTFGRKIGERFEKKRSNGIHYIGIGLQQ